MRKDDERMGFAPVKDKPTLTEISPHLTPKNLIGKQFGKGTFNNIKVALVGYCPRPGQLDKYNPQNTTDQYFIHVPPASVQICNYNKMEFLSVVHVYGGPVSSALIEELAYYKIKYILAYGLAGGLGTKNQKLGDYYLVEEALARDGTTPHYTNKKLISSSRFLNSKIKELAKNTGFPIFMRVQALTADAIYREYARELASAKKAGCDIVNCDSSHLFAVSRVVGIKSTECGVISDVVKASGKGWDSTLAKMLKSDNTPEPSALDLAGKIVKFYVETLMPDLMGV